MKRWIGRSVMGIGLVHTAVGALAGQTVIAAVASERFLASVGPQMDRQAIFWFLFFGFLLMAFGYLLDWLEARELVPPAGLAFSLLLMAVVGVGLMPASGWWLVLVPAGALCLRARRAASAPSGTGAA